MDATLCLSLGNALNAMAAGFIAEVLENLVAGDAEDCARRIIELAGDPALCATLGASGRRYVLEEGHNWEDESAPALVAAYDRLFASELRA